MVSPRARATLSTLLLVVGAMLVGDALNGGVVASRFGVTTPGFVFRVVIGGMAIAVGYQLRTPVGEYVATPSDDPGTADPETGEGTEFDPDLSPVDGEIEGAERSEGRVATPEGGREPDDQSTNSDEEAKGTAEGEVSDGRDDGGTLE